MRISQRIKEDLAHCLQVSGHFPVPLTIAALARHYSVSFSPVRAAIESLLKVGLLKKAANKRLLPAKREKHAALDTAQPFRFLPDLTGLPAGPDAYDVIAEDCVVLSLRGNACYLREEALAAKHAISRSSVRNILHKLAGEDIVQHVPRCGWRLRPFRREDLESFNQVRVALELKALELARFKLARPELQRMFEANVLPQTAGETPRIDDSLHGYFIDLSGNPFIQDFFRKKAPYFRLLFVWEGRDSHACLQTVNQHREILGALIEKRWRSAEKALTHHILHNHDVLLQSVEAERDMA
jgi:DNA-binding GntR family transcriptional regulator